MNNYAHSIEKHLQSHGSIIQATMLFIFIFSSLLFAQSTIKIHGTVTDAETRLPLPGVNIRIDNSGVGTTSDRSGTFSFDNLLLDNYTLVFSHIAYTEKTVRNIGIVQDSPRELNISLTPHTLSMPQVQVEAKRAIPTIQHGVQVLDREYIRRSAANDLGELLINVHGVDIVDNGGPGGARKIAIRGSQNNQVLVLVDDVPINNELTGEADLSQVPVHLIEKVEIYTGAASHRFGSGALAGAVNIIMRHDLEHHLQISANMGPWGQQSIQPTLAGRYKGLDLLASVKARSAKGDFPYTFINSAGQPITEDRLNVDMSANNLFLRASFKIKDHAFSAHWQKLDSDRGLPGKIDGWTPWARTGYQQQIAGLEYRHQFKKVLYTLQPRYSTMETENTNIYPADAELRYKRYPQYHYRDKVSNRVINNRVQTEWSDIKLTMGHTLQQQSFDHINLMPVLVPSDLKADETANGGYIDMDWHRRRGPLYISIAPAVRYDDLQSNNGKQDRHDRQWSPAIRGYLTWGDQSKLVVGSALSRSFRVPTYADLFYQETRIDGNPDLLPETALNREFSIGYELNMWGTLFVQATGFRQKIDNLIVWRLGSFEVFRPYNTHARLSGLEYQLNLQTPQQLLSLQMGYSDLSPQNRNDNETTFGRTLPYRSAHSFKGAIDLNYRNVRLSLRYRYGSKRYINEANTQSLPPYEVWDLDIGLNTTLYSCTVNWMASARNLTDAEYVIIRDMPLPGREWRLGMEISY